jgi:hypothetical protein
MAVVLGYKYVREKKNVRLRAPFSCGILKNVDIRGEKCCFIGY